MTFYREIYNWATLLIALKAETKKRERSLKFLEWQLWSQGALRIGRNSIYHEPPGEHKVSDSMGCTYPIPQCIPSSYITHSRSSSAKWIDESPEEQMVEKQRKTSPYRCTWDLRTHEKLVSLPLSTAKGFSINHWDVKTQSHPSPNFMPEYQYKNKTLHKFILQSMCWFTSISWNKDSSGRYLKVTSISDLLGWG